MLTTRSVRQSDCEWPALLNSKQQRNKLLEKKNEVKRSKVKKYDELLNGTHRPHNRMNECLARPIEIFTGTSKTSQLFPIKT